MEKKDVVNVCGVVFHVVRSLLSGRIDLGSGCVNGRIGVQLKCILSHVVD